MIKDQTSYRRFVQRLHTLATQAKNISYSRHSSINDRSSDAVPGRKYD